MTVARSLTFALAMAGFLVPGSRFRVLGSESGVRGSDARQPAIGQFQYRAGDRHRRFVRRKIHLPIVVPGLAAIA